MTTSAIKDIRPTGLALLVFVCGLFNDVSLQLVGQFYLSELFVLIAALIGVLFWKGNELFDARMFRSFMLVGWVTLLGYVASDIYVGTDPSQYLRGWGRTVLMITNCFAIMLLAMKSRQNLWWFIFGSGVGGVVYLYITGVPFHAWKLGYGERIAMIVLPLLVLAPRKLWAILMLAFGVLNIVLDYRSLGAGFVVAAAIVLSNAIQARNRVLILGLAGAITAAVIVAAVSVTDDEYKAHRLDSNIGRTSAIIVSLKAIVQSPILGYGSWTEHAGFAAELRKEINKKRAEVGGDVDFTRLWSGSGFQSHSQIIQSWVEGGVFGAVFFFFYGYRLLQSISWCALRRSLDAFTPIFSFTLVMGLWNLFMSPALGYSRMQIALAVGAIVVVLAEKKKMAGTVVQTPSATTFGDADPPRVLRRARQGVPRS